VAAAVPEESGSFAERVGAFESGLLRAALEASRFNQRQAAQRLGLTYDQLRHHLKKHGITARAEA
jgi:psp operon transcriptional activator